MSNLHEQFPGGNQRDTKGEICYMVGDLFRSRHLILPLTLVRQIEQASLLLGQLSNLLQLEDHNLMVSGLLMRKEAVASVSLAGEAVTLWDLYKHERQPQTNWPAEVTRANHYTKILAWGTDYLTRADIDTYFIQMLHDKVSKQSDQTSAKSDYRKKYLPTEQSLPTHQDFAPPAPENIDECVTNIVDYISSNNTEFPLLIKIAISHYQMMIVRPFDNFNAETTRILSVLLFMKNHLPFFPVVPISEIFLKHYEDYNNLMIAARISPKELVDWISFFLNAVIDSIAKTNQAIHETIILKTALEQLINEKMNRKKKQGMRLLRLLFSSPCIQTKDISKQLAVSNQTAHNLLDDFLELGIINETTGKKRNRIFEFGAYLDQF